MKNSAAPSGRRCRLPLLIILLTPRAVYSNCHGASIFVLRTSQFSGGEEAMHEFARPWVMWERVL